MLNYDLYLFVKIQKNIVIKRFKGVTKTMDNYNTELITVDELCDALMIGKNAAYKLLASGKLKCFRFNRIWKIPRSSVDEYIRKQSSIA